tara:strand:+ start:660 stop:1262 length:603 start_codon:yes stop_codon:yes gene_type:complete
MRYSRRLFIALSSVGIIKSIRAKDLCNFTPSQPLGPFFKKENLVQNSDMTNKGLAKGQILNIYGQITDKNCNPYPKSSLIIWQANAFGKYNHHNDLSNNASDPNFNGYTKIVTTKKGFYNFTTIIPGAYKISNTIKRPPHIHVLVKTRDNKRVITQLYFKNHPLNEGDFLYNSHKKNSRLQLNLKHASGGLSRAKFDFII